MMGPCIDFDASAGPPANYSGHAGARNGGNLEGCLGEGGGGEGGGRGGGDSETSAMLRQRCCRCTLAQANTHGHAAPSLWSRYDGVTRVAVRAGASLH